MPSLGAPGRRGFGLAWWWRCADAIKEIGPRKVCTRAHVGGVDDGRRAQEMTAEPTRDALFISFLLFFAATRAALYEF